MSANWLCCLLLILSGETLAAESITFDIRSEWPLRQ